MRHALPFAAVAVLLSLTACGEKKSPAAGESATAAPTAPPAPPPVPAPPEPAAAPATAPASPTPPPTAPKTATPAPTAPKTATPAPTAPPTAPPAATPVATGTSTAAATAAPPAPAAASAHAHVGPEKCKGCHKVQYDSWAASPHKAKGLDCEGCHGNGADYKAVSVMKDRAAAVAAGLVMPGVDFCKKCHAKADAAQLQRAHKHKGQ